MTLFEALNREQDMWHHCSRYVNRQTLNKLLHTNKAL